MDEHAKIEGLGGAKASESRDHHNTAPRKSKCVVGQREPLSEPSGDILASSVTSNTPITDAACKTVLADLEACKTELDFKYGVSNAMQLLIHKAKELELECAEWRRDAEALYKFLHACFPDVPTGTATALANHEKLVSQHRQGRTE